MKIKIIPNPKKPWAKDLAREIATFLSGKHRVVRRGADATICIGGDGTILYAGHRKRLEGAVLGIGTENSYICQLRRENWKERILAALGGPTVAIMALGCEAGGRRYRAINDVVVHATHYRVAELSVSMDWGGTSRQAKFEGDGIIISSAIGSAAYAFSAGGPKLVPTESKLSLVPICPYKRAFSPVLLPEDGRASVTAGSDCALIIDGIYVRRLRKGEVVRVGKAEHMKFFEGVGTQ